MNRRILAACVAGIAAWPGAAPAQAERALPEVRVQGARNVTGSSVLSPVLERFDQAPVTVRVLGPEVLVVPGTHAASAALEHDVSVGENYAITGYYENFHVRGFLLDLGSSYRINGFVVPGELHIALDNKEAIELLKGVGNLTGGTVGAGGIVNFVGRRPADVRGARVEWEPRGGSYVGIDLGRATGEQGLGVRLNVAHEEMRPAEHRADGRRDFLALAVDVQPASAWTVMLDAEYGRREQPAVPGFQLLAGTTLPENVDPRTNINRQPWSRPVRNEGHLLGIRAQRALTSDARLMLGFSDARARIDDSLAFPFGCNDAPFHYFCADASYVLYDYRAFERRRTRHAQASFSGSWRSGGLRHDFHAGAEHIVRRIEQRQLYSSTVFDDAGRALTGNLADTSIALPAPRANGVDAPDRRAGQSALFVADQMAWGAWRAHAGARWVRIDQTPAVVRHRVLPQLGLTWLRSSEERFYASAARGLEFGSEAPVVAQNAGALLPPRLGAQWELGWRREWGAAHAIAAAVFRAQRPFEFTEPAGASWAGLGEHVQAGRQVHTGVELQGRSRPLPAWTIAGQLALLRAQARATGVPAYEGHQLQNVPRVRLDARVAHTPAAWPQLEGELRWLHVGARTARRDGSVQVPGYHRFDAGLAWKLRQGAREVKLGVVIRNLADRRYWRDVGEAYSADLLFPGRPRSIAAGLTIEGL